MAVNKYNREELKASLIRTAVLIKKNLLRFWKNPKSLGFLVGIPVMYYIFVGLIFGGTSEDGLSSYTIGWIDDDSTQANYTAHPFYSVKVMREVMEDIDDLEVNKYNSKSEANAAALQDEINAYVYFPEGFEESLEERSQDNTTELIKYQIFFPQSVSPTTKSVIKNLVSGVISGVINYDSKDIIVDYKVKSTVGQEVNNLTYQAPGLMLYGPMTILSFAVIVLTSEKKDGIYKRLSSSEVRNWELVFSSIIANIVLIFMQFSIGLIILSIFGWNPVIFSLTDAILGLILTIFLFSFFILALAFAVTPIFKDPDTAGGGVWIILIPLMMLSGIFFPIEFFGDQMQMVANLLPTRYAVLILQGLFLKGLPLSDPSIIFNFGILTLYSAAIFIIGIKAFNRFKK